MHRILSKVTFCVALLLTARLFAAAPDLSGKGFQTRVFVDAEGGAHPLPIWNFCGDKDRPETVKANRDMAEAFKTLGANAKYTEYPNVPHNCWDNAYGTDELYTWMLAQSRNRNKGS